MSNPLDDAFAKADAARARATAFARAQESAAELEAREWIKAYREVLEAVPRHVERPPERLTLAWPAASEPPSVVAVGGEGLDRNLALAFGACDAWCFTHREGYEKGNVRKVYVAADCSTVFTAERSAYIRVRGRLRTRSVSAQLIDPFADVETGRHTLRLEVSPGVGGAERRVLSSTLPSPTQLTEIIAGLKLSSSPAISWVR
jgi:hypothetical protein